MTAARLRVVAEVARTRTRAEAAVGPKEMPTALHPEIGMTLHLRLLLTMGARKEARKVEAKEAEAEEAVEGAEEPHPMATSGLQTGPRRIPAKSSFAKSTTWLATATASATSPTTAQSRGPAMGTSAMHLQRPTSLRNAPMPEQSRPMGRMKLRSCLS